jgi:hypothetical protein
MATDTEQEAELVRHYPGAGAASDGGVTYYLLPNLELPQGCSPARLDALLCPTNRDGYESRLFYSSLVSGCPDRNWNGRDQRILERNWYAFSWRTRAGLRLSQMVQAHLHGLKAGTP